LFGFTLNERLGKLAFWCWLIGFLVAFLPIYALGIMGATRRLDHYDPSMGWQGLFIVAAVGVAIILLGVAFQVLQFAYSIYKRNENRDLSGDPWNGRTLEWSISSPPPEYNYAELAPVESRDEFWRLKQLKHKPATNYNAITMPKNTPLPVLIGLLSLTAGFGLVWHIFWLSLICILGILSLIIYRTSGRDNEYVISAEKVKAEELRSVA
jgi:cytochrome o ubiquinol oxidase subunit 1